jgi:hypothetical protein
MKRDTPCPICRQPGGRHSVAPHLGPSLGRTGPGASVLLSVERGVTVEAIVRAWQVLTGETRQPTDDERRRIEAVMSRRHA